MKHALRKGIILTIAILCMPVMAEQGSKKDPDDYSSLHSKSEQGLSEQTMTNSNSITATGTSTNIQALIFANDSSATFNGQINNSSEIQRQWQTQQNNIISSNMTAHYRKWQEDNNALVRVEKINYQDTLTSKAQYNYGRFSAETGFFSENSAQSSNTIFYLQSSLIVLNLSSFNLAVAARLDEQNIDYYNLNGVLADKPVYTSTLGIVGTYSLNKRWHVTGAVTTTSANENFINGQVADQNQYNQAVIGTTYSF
jgi:hypothetical protein